MYHSPNINSVIVDIQYSVVLAIVNVTYSPAQLPSNMVSLCHPDKSQLMLILLPF